MKSILPALVLFVLCTCALYADSDSALMVFEERIIEGKIRRPQLVLISADQRPEIGPVLLFSGYTSLSIGSEDELFGTMPHESPFQFRGKELIYPGP